jgi:hypothetical protein
VATTLIVKIRTAAASYAPLTALLQAGSVFQMYTEQTIQNSVAPWVTVRLISNPRVYAFTGRMSTNYARVEFLIFGAAPGGENARAVRDALMQFLDQFNAAGLTNLPANSNDVLDETELGIAETQPQTFQIRLQARIFNNESVN